MSQDVLETPNRYAYVGGNVVNRVDLNGLQALCWVGGVLVLCPDPIVVTIPPITWIPPGVTPTIPTPTPTPYPITPQPTQPPTIGTPIPTAPTAGVTPTPTATPAPTLTPAPTAAPTATPAPVPSASVPAPYVTPLPSDYAVCVVSSPTPTATAQPSCKVEIGAFPAFQLFGGLVFIPGYHLFIAHTNESGGRLAFRGGPTPGASFGWGAIFAEVQTPPPLTPNSDLAKPNTRWINAMQGSEACGKDICLAAEVARINTLNRPYFPFGPNSNTVASTFQNRCGINRIKPAGIWTPGWNYGDL